MAGKALKELSKIYKIGDWSKVMTLVANMRKDFKMARKKSLTEAGKKTLAELRGHIKAQDLPWKPLSTKYLEQKAQKGYPLDTLYATGQFRDSLTIIQKEGMVFIGIPNGARTKDTGEQLTTIAAVHEFGSDGRGIEARPLFRPTMDDVKKWNKVKNNPSKHILKCWKEKYPPSVTPERLAKPQ